MGVCRVERSCMRKVVSEQSFSSSGPCRWSFLVLKMIRDYKGPFPFNRATLEEWDSCEKGVYYIGVLNSASQLLVYYIGKGCGEGGMKERLLSHLGRWKDATHFGYHGCDHVPTIDTYEVSEITTYKPRYNVQGV